MATSNHKQLLYEQLVESLTMQIEHNLRPGDMLPSERDLSESYGLSRTTVRLALKELERQGLVQRLHGRGTFVTNSHDTAANLLDSYSFTEQMKAIGRDPSTVTLEFSEMEADKGISKNMDCAQGAMVFRLKRLRYADGTPVMIEYTYLPADRFFILTRSMLEDRSLYDIIENDFQVTIQGAEEEVYANIARPDDARLLEIDKGDPVLNLKRHTYDNQHNLIEYTLSVARSDQFKYRTYYNIHD